jgi:hypothetical protein
LYTITEAREKKRGTIIRYTRKIMLCPSSASSNNNDEKKINLGMSTDGNLEIPACYECSHFF